MIRLINLIASTAVVCSILATSALADTAETGHNAPTAAPAGHAGVPFPNSPEIAPIGVRLDTFLDIRDSARGIVIEPAKGYRLEKLGRGLYMVTDNGYQSMFMVYETGVVVVDAPPSYAAKLKQAIAEVTNLPIAHII